RGRPRFLERVGNAELREGPARTAGPGGARRRPRPFPRRPGGGSLTMPGLVGPDEVRAVADAALEVRGADGVEVLFLHEWGGLTRFADSSIHQSTWRQDTGLRVRVVLGGRVAVA